MAVLAAWAFPSSSGSTTYETTLDEAGTLSCNCPGFIFKKKGQARGCKHTRQIEPYTARLLAQTLTPELVGAWLGVASHALTIENPDATNGSRSVAVPVSSPTETSPTSTTPLLASLPPLVERHKRRIDFEE